MDETNGRVGSGWWARVSGAVVGIDAGADIGIVIDADGSLSTF